MLNNTLVNFKAQTLDNGDILLTGSVPKLDAAFELHAKRFMGSHIIELHSIECDASDLDDLADSVIDTAHLYLGDEHV